MKDGMKKIFLLVVLFSIACWGIPKPMESITNYNVMMVHGCDNSCPLPGTLKKVTIKTSAPQDGESTVVLEVLKAKQRHVLPMKMFDVE